MLKTIDGWIEAGHQYAVDWSQKKPAWWGRQVAILLTCFSAVLLLAQWDTMFESLQWAGIIMNAVCLLFMFVFSTNDWLFAAHPASSVMCRKVTTTMLVLALLVHLGFDIGYTVRTVHWAGATILYTIYCYFATCRPPAPPKRKTEPSKVAHGML